MSNQLSILTRMAAEEQQASGLNPHEWLKMIADGMPVKQMVPIITTDPDTNEQSTEWVERLFYPNISVRIDCAKAAAQFFAPKYTAIKATVQRKESKYAGYTDEELETMLAELTVGESGVVQEGENDKPSH